LRKVMITAFLLAVGMAIGPPLFADRLFVGADAGITADPCFDASATAANDAESVSEAGDAERAPVSDAAASPGNCNDCHLNEGADTRWRRYVSFGRSNITGDPGRNEPQIE